MNQEYYYGSEFLPCRSGFLVDNKDDKQSLHGQIRTLHITSSISVVHSETRQKRYWRTAVSPENKLYNCIILSLSCFYFHCYSRAIAKFWLCLSHQYKLLFTGGFEHVALLDRSKDPNVCWLSRQLPVGLLFFNLYRYGSSPGRRLYTFPWVQYRNNNRMYEKYFRTMFNTS